MSSPKQRTKSGPVLSADWHQNRPQPGPTAKPLLRLLPRLQTHGFEPENVRGPAHSPAAHPGLNDELQEEEEAGEEEEEEQ